MNDLYHAESNLALLRTLSELDIRTGRKSTQFKEIFAEMHIRQKSTVDQKAEFVVE